MEAYSATAFTSQKIAAELNNPNSEFYFALHEGRIIGYLKLNFNDAQTEFGDKNAMEIERIYVSGAHHGKHIGRQLLNFAVDMAVKKALNYIWLGVWEHNDKAIGFYEYHGFERFGSHEFLLGDELQQDLLMRREL